MIRTIVFLLLALVAGVQAEIITSGYVTPDPSSGFVAGDLNVGFHIPGTLSVDNNSVLSVGDDLFVGNFGGTGSVTVDNGSLTVSNDTEIGHLNNGSFLLTNGARVDLLGSLYMGNGASGTVRVDGGSFFSSGSTYLGSPIRRGHAGYL